MPSADDPTAPLAALNPDYLNRLFRNRNAAAWAQGPDAWDKEQEWQKAYWRKHPASEGQRLASLAQRLPSEVRTPSAAPVSPPEPPEPSVDPDAARGVLKSLRKSPLWEFIVGAAAGDEDLVARVALRIGTTLAPQVLLAMQDEVKR